VALFSCRDSSASKMRPYKVVQRRPGPWAFALRAADLPFVLPFGRSPRIRSLVSRAVAECALCVYSGGDDWGSGDRRHRRTPGVQVPIFGPFVTSPATSIHQVPPPLLFRSCCAKPSAQTLTYKLFFIPI